MGEYNICIAVKERLAKDSGVAEEAAYNDIVVKLLSKPKAKGRHQLSHRGRAINFLFRGKGVIIFGSDQEVSEVMRAVRRANATGNFSWIGSDGWSGRALVTNGNEAEVEGTLSVQPQASKLKGFEKYFLSLTPQNNKRNPWFIGTFHAIQPHIVSSFRSLP